MALNYNHVNVLKFLTQFNSLQVPYYQRNYVWAKPENEFVLRKFLDDIIDEFDENQKQGYNSEYFIGNCALYTRNSTYIIDGAQRISTLIIFLAELSKLTNSNKISFFSGGNFIMGGESKVSNELQYFVFGKQVPGYIPDSTCPIAAAQRLIEKRITDLLKSNSLSYLKGLEDFILNNVFMFYIMFSTEKEALKYFLNINSLSIQLTEMEIFCAFVSQLIYYTQSTTTSIDRVKEQIKIIDNRLGTKVSDEDIVFIFLNAYFKNDHDIGKLRDKKSKTGIGKWLTGYKMDLLSNSSEATKFIDALARYIADIDIISTYLIGTNANTTKYKFIWFISIFNKYTKNAYLNDLLIYLFKNRHNYQTENIYANLKNTTVIDEKKLNSYCKAAASVIVIHYFRGRIKDLSRNDDKNDIKLSERTENKQNPSFTIKNISYPNIWNLKYPIDRQAPNYSIPNNYDEIFFILALQEAYLNSIANPVYNGQIVKILDELLTSNYQIEHLITKEDWTRDIRRLAWQSLGRFTSPAEYDDFRSRFENLSLLDGPTNASASSDMISVKFNKYKNAHTIMSTNEDEYLVQSLVPSSNFYTNEKLKSCGSREISINQDGITWNHNADNHKFIENLSKAAVQELFKD